MYFLDFWIAFNKSIILNNQKSNILELVLFGGKLYIYQYILMDE